MTVRRDRQLSLGSEPRRRRTSAAPIVAAFLFGLAAVILAAATASAQDCTYRPGNPAEEFDCLQRLCGRLPAGAERSACIRNTQSTWDTIEECRFRPVEEQEACQRDAFRDRVFAEVRERIDRHRLILSILEDVACLRGGGGFEECFGPIRLTPPPPPEPFVISELRRIGPNERGLTRKSVEQELRARFELESAWIATAFEAAERPQK